MEKKNINIAIIGAGKIAGSVVPSLIASGYKVSAIVSRLPESAEKLALDNGIKKYSGKLEDIPKDINFFILSVPDSKIEETAQELFKLDFNFKSSCFIHLSGSLSSELLKPLVIKGGLTGSLHIMQSFPDRTSRDFAGAYSAYETSSAELEEILLALCADLKLHPFKIAPEHKFLYHLCGGYASNFFMANFYLLRKNFEKMNISEDKMYDIFLPMIRSTIWNIERNGFVRSLSGPVERGDANVIKGHLDSISDDRTQRKYYSSGTLALLETAREKGSITAEKYEEIKALLTKVLDE